MDSQDAYEFTYPGMSMDNCSNDACRNSSLYWNTSYGEFVYVDQDVSFWQIPQLIILVLLFVFIVFGNTCVLVAISLSETGRKTRMNFFIMNLAIADLAVGLFHLTVDIAEKCLVVWVGGPALCKIIRFLQVLVVYSSSFMLVSLSIDRVDAIARPMNFTRKAVTVRALVYAAWVTSGLLSIPSLVLFDIVYVNDQPFCIMTLQEHWHWQVYITLIALTAFIIPALCIIVCYSIIIFVIWDKGRGFSTTFQSAIYRARPNQELHRRDRRNKGVIPQAKIRTFKMTLIIVCVFVLSWCPYFVFNLVDVYEAHSTRSTTEYAIATLIQSLAPLNSAANPIIYGLFSARICHNLRRIPLVGYICDWCCRCRERRQSSMHGNNASNTEQTFLDATSSKSVLRRFGNNRRLGNEYETSNLLIRGQVALHPGQSGSCADPHSAAVNRIKIKQVKMEKPKFRFYETKKKKNFYHRRPSGLPLVNRKMTFQETIILETYRDKSHKGSSNGKPAYLNGVKSIKDIDNNTSKDGRNCVHFHFGTGNGVIPEENQSVSV